MYEKTQAMIKEKLDQGVYPGVVYRFFDKDKSETHALGYAAVVPHKEQMTSEALFDVASLTKVVCTTTVILKLVGRGQVEIDRSLHQYLPSFKNTQITLRHLLTHTADIQTYIPDRDQLDQQELREAYLSFEPGDQLGKKVQYTDAGTILLGFMLEELYQQAVVTIFQQEVLVPLGMTDSYFLPDATLNSRIVPTQQQVTGEVLRGVTHDPKARVLGRHAGNAGLFTNVDDLGKFCEMLVNWGLFQGQSFLKRETIESLLQDQTPTGEGGRSLGWDLRSKRDGTFLFHTGYTGTFLLVDPERKRYFIFLSNRLHPQDHRDHYQQERDKIVDCYFQEL